MKLTKQQLKKIEEVEKRLDPPNFEEQLLSLWSNFEEQLLSLWSNYSAKPNFMVVGSDTYKWLKNLQKPKRKKSRRSKKH
jgi:hypothetical protein